MLCIRSALASATIHGATILLKTAHFKFDWSSAKTVIWLKIQKYLLKLCNVHHPSCESVYVGVPRLTHTRKQQRYSTRSMPSTGDVVMWRQVCYQVTKQYFEGRTQSDRCKSAGDIGSIYTKTWPYVYIYESADTWSFSIPFSHAVKCMCDWLMH